MYAANVILGNGTKLEGASSNANTPALPLIQSRDAGLAGVPPTDLNLLRCFGAADVTSAYLDPAKVAGKVLVLGVTPGRITPLHTLDAADLPGAPDDAAAPAGKDFQSWLKQTLERRSR